MVRITKVYTKTGDAGKTRLAGGQEIAKNAARIEAFGTVDELNAFLGWAVQGLSSEDQLPELQKRMMRIQNELFDLGSQLAVLAEDRREGTPVIISSDVERLESEIDDMNDDLPPLKSFILPGGGELATRLHISRTVCRRAERQLVRLLEKETLDGTELPYLNRLSDWLFVASRYVSWQTGNDEFLWKPGER